MAPLAAAGGACIARRGARAAVLSLLMMLATPAAWAAPEPAPADPAFLTAQQQLLFQQMQADPTNLDAILAYANVSAKLGDNEAAVSALQRLLLFNPDLLSANLELGALYFRMGSFAMARAYFAKAIAAGPPPDIKERIDQYLAQIAVAESPSHVSGSLLLGTQYQSDANVATASPLISSPVGPLLLSSEFVKKPDQNVFLAGSALFSQDLGTANHDTFEVTGTGFVQHYFRVQRLELDFGEVTAGPRLQFPDPGIPGLQAASFKPYAIINEVGLGQNQYFYTYGGGLEGTAALWGDLNAKLNFEFRHKTFSNAPDRPNSTGLDGDDKLVSLGLTRPINEASAVTADFDFLAQDAAVPYYADKSYAVSAGYRVRYDDPTKLVGLPWETTVWGSRLWSFYDGQDPCCNTSSTPGLFGESTQRTSRWRFGVTQVFQVADNLGVFVQAQRDIVSSNLPFYAYTSNSVLIGPQFRFAAAPGAAQAAAADEMISDQPAGSGDDRPLPALRVEGNGGVAFGSNSAKAALRTRSVSLNTNSTTLTGTGFAGGATVWADGPLAAWTGNNALENVSFGLEYRHVNDSESTGVTATVPSGIFAGSTVAGSVNGNFDAESVFLDAAWRLNGGSFHPYVGLGGGVAVLDWKATLNAPALAALGVSSTSFASGIVAPVAAGHLFAGLDYDITPRLYLGVGGDFYFTDTAAKNFTHTSIQLNANELSLLGHVGYRL